MMTSYISVFLLLCNWYSVTKNDQVCPNGCMCTSQLSGVKLQCDHIPTVVPSNTTEFELLEVEAFSNWIHFTDLSWKSVRSMSLHVWNHRSRTAITSNSFLGVPALEFLKITNFQNLLEFPTGTFGHLQHLRMLDLSDNKRLSFARVVSIIPDLQKLDLETFNFSRNSNFEALAGSTTIRLDPKMLTRFTKLKIRNLDISWNGRLTIDADNMTGYDVRAKHLEVINGSHITYAFTKRHLFETVFPNLKHAVFQGIFWTSLPHGVLRECDLDLVDFDYKAYCADHDLFILPPHLETLNFDDVKLFEGRCVEQILLPMIPEYFICVASNRLRSISLKNCGLTGFNVALLTFDSLVTLDLRGNRINTITDISIRYLSNLTRLLLGSNELWQFQSNALFKNLLNYSTELEEIDLSFNRLTMLSRKMFIRNEKLHVIDLSNNHLNTLSVDIALLSNLQVLNLSSNTISAIDEDLSNGIEKVRPRFNNSFIDLSNNKMNCSCQSMTFIATVHKISPFLIFYESYVCSYKGRNQLVYLVDDADLNRECIYKIISVVLPPIGAVIVIIVLIIVLRVKWVYVIRLYVAFRFWKHRKKLTEADDRVFLSYSHHDKELVLGHIYPVLNLKLQQYLHTDSDVLYINDKDFALPGVIDEEIVRAVSSCKCTVALVSRHFLESSWTHLEVSYSWFKKRPIILIFLDQIKEKELRGVLRYLYNKKVRLVWPKTDIQEHKDAFWTNLLRGLAKILDVGVQKAEVYPT